jgi:hypothetical protein
VRLDHAGDEVLVDPGALEARPPDRLRPAGAAHTSQDTVAIAAARQTASKVSALSGIASPNMVPLGTSVPKSITTSSPAAIPEGRGEHSDRVAVCRTDY